MRALLSQESSPKELAVARVQEVFAGTTGWSKACESAGLMTNKPIEMFADPTAQAGRDSEQDTLEGPRSRLLQAAAEPPGPSVANVWQFGTPCTSFCSHNIENGGTRSRACPKGTEHKQVEKDGNALAALTCECCLALFGNGNEFLFESSAPDGR